MSKILKKNIYISQKILSLKINIIRLEIKAKKENYTSANIKNIISIFKLFIYIYKFLFFLASLSNQL